MGHDSNREEQQIFAEEALIVDAQGLLQELLDKKGFTRAELARAMGVSRARISQLFSDECKNFTLRLWARALFALGEEAVVSYAGSEECLDHYFAGRTDLHDENSIMSSSEWKELQSQDLSADCFHANDNVFGGLSEVRNTNARFEVAA